MKRCVGKHVGLLLMTLLWFRASFTTAQKPSFLSIDCGTEAGYTDGIGIKWVKDDHYISTGLNLKGSFVGGPGSEAFSTVRYFNETRNKHCYVLPAIPDTTYLIRVVILHGGIPELLLPAKFDVTVNSNNWFTHSVSEGDSSLLTPLTYEAILYNRRDHIDVCLIEGVEGKPWISSLELRAMPTTGYTTAKIRDKFMINTWRYNTGIKTDKIVRWPEDAFDRIWFPARNDTFLNVDRVSNSTVLPYVPSYIDGYNQPPDAVMMDAFVGPDLTFDNWFVPVGTKEVYVATFFQDVRNVPATKSNPVGIFVGVQGSQYELNVTSGYPYFLHYHKIVTGNKVNITIAKLPWYKGDLFLNAVEVYTLTSINSILTLEDDVTALRVLQTSFRLTSWKGDPCYPVSYNWVTCDNRYRISGLYLSNKNITGTIPTEIGDLTALKEIYLDNNKICGSIPESLAFLYGLTVLALDNNTLRGEIPSAFQNKAGFTFSGNPNLIQRMCQPTDAACIPNPKPKPDNTEILVGADVRVYTAVLLIICLMVIFTRKRKSKRKPKPILEINMHNIGTPGGEGAAVYHSESNQPQESTQADGHRETSNAPRDGGSNLSPKNQPSAKASAYQVAGLISMSEELIATRNHQRKIGEGGYGPVYYGKLPNGEGE